MLDYHVAIRRATGQHVRQKLLYAGRALSGKEQEEAATAFVILSGITEMEDEVERSFKADIIDLMQNKILKDRFGHLPAWAESNLAAATPETLKIWSHRLHRADSLEDILA